MNAALPDPREPIATAFWRCCAGCSAWLAHPHDQPQDARYENAFTRWAARRPEFTAGDDWLAGVHKPAGTIGAA